ncbi:hypothetical protein B0T13DRAFT_225987 [Neurospora crassa]|nr:hypothetical protein B0T13DRAFT_225987 [Neurospora crassa]
MATKLRQTDGTKFEAKGTGGLGQGMEGKDMISWPAHMTFWLNSGVVVVAACCVRRTTRPWGGMEGVFIYFGLVFLRVLKAAVTATFLYLLLR